MSGLRTHGSTIWRKDSSDYLTTCTMSLTFSTRTCRTNPRLAKDPPSKTTTGLLSSCLLKRNQKNTIWRKGSSHYLTTCTMSPSFSTRPCRTNPRLAKDSPLNFPPPPPEQPRVLCHLVFWKKPEKTPFGARVIFTQFLFLSALLCYLYYVSYLFQLEHAGKV